MNRLEHTRTNKLLRKKRIRSSVKGTVQRPRLSVHISNRHVAAQLIDDSTGKTLVSSSTVHAKEVGGSLRDLCAFVGADIAKKASKIKIKQVVLDRNGRAYHIRLAAFANAARENGLEF